MTDIALQGATFQDAVAATPPVYDQQAADDCLERCAPPTGNAQALLAGAAGGAPFLRRTAEREAEWLNTIWGRPLDATWSELLRDTKTAAAADLPEPEAMRILRVARRRAALLIALADLGAVWDLDQTTTALTDFADAALQAAMARLVAREAATGKLPSLSPETPGLFALAMGKMGAHELNYSSDIDLILLFDPERLAPEDQGTAKERFPRLARQLVKLLSELTADGYVARVDLRLRPDPGATPAVLSTEAAERYYEAMGRTWERAAHIKARVSAGDAASGAAYLEALSPFVWRRHLDFAAIEETAGILAKIREVEGGAEVMLRGHDVKLGAGGIREIEFFAQTQQLVLGGRDRSLRAPRTRDALKALVAAGRLEEETRQKLDAAYDHLRRLEHRLQMIEDRQTHRAPEDDAECERVAALMGAPDFATLEAETLAHMNQVRASSAWFDPRPAGGATRLSLEPALRALPDPEAATRLVESWQSGHYRALRSEKARAKLERLTPELLSRMAAASDPMGALMRFDRFIQGLPAGVQLFSLFEETPALLDLITEVAAVAPRLAETLARRTAVFDAVLDPDFFDPPPAETRLATELEAVLAPLDDYEHCLDATRRWAAERRFQTGVGLLRGVIEPTVAAAAYSDIASVCIAALAPRVVDDMRRRAGGPPGDGAAVLAMGNLGSREMTASSDVDLIVVYDADHTAESDGPRPVAAPQYYARFTQALTLALTAPTSEGALYEVDMRLRPSGKAGPLATSLTAFKRYQQEDAWVWEHMALTRSRVLVGSDRLRASLSEAACAALAKPRTAGEVLTAAAEMRQRLDQAHTADLNRLWALKHGHGGLIDVEFIAQAGQLAAGVAEIGVSTAAGLARLGDANFLTRDDADQLTEAYGLLFALHQMRRVAMEPPFDVEAAGPGVKRILARAAGADDFSAIEPRLEAAKKTVRAAFDAYIGHR
ncbi:MAG: bifunctional [glutamine synthetase] adenylyltransferase/[glutamine synthetase]-adenylyl-L-tyrosine phosphorylase [Neomegalonema sp.]|nr:bifunctional [glutamine synthetase] adenylyltransferase/[glutamine synthetase]-adenylyl-L-tyrosine phosphorylase [Neomegalonema sp.]